VRAPSSTHYLRVSPRIVVNTEVGSRVASLNFSTDGLPVKRAQYSRSSPSNEKLVPSTPIGKSSIPLRKKNQRKEVCQETSPKFISTSSRALNWIKLVLQSLTSFSIGGWIFSTIGADTY